MTEPPLGDGSEAHTERYYTVKEVARLLKVSPDFVRDHIPSIELGGARRRTRRIAQSTLNAWVKNRSLPTLDEKLYATRPKLALRRKEAHQPCLPFSAGTKDIARTVAKGAHIGTADASFGLTVFLLDGACVNLSALATGATPRLW